LPDAFEHHKKGFSNMTQILHPSVIENLCRRTLALNHRHSLIALRVALQASIDHGSGWFSVRDAFDRLGGVSKNLASPGPLAERLEFLGAAKHKLTSFPNYTRYDAQLICPLVDTGFFHG
jgi:hypothetical protein